MRTRVKLLLSAALLSGAAAPAAPRPLGAQSEYRNVDGGRPVRIEDALVTPYHAMNGSRCHELSAWSEWAAWQCDSQTVAL
jgi:hypothetical protein